MRTNQSTKETPLLPSTLLSIDDHEYVGVGETGEFHRRLHEDRREWEFHALDLSRQFQQTRRHFWISMFGDA